MTSAAKWPSGPGETTRSRPVREGDQRTRREERREKKSCAPAVGQVGDTWAGHPWGPAWVTRAQSSSKLTDRTWETFGLKPRTQTQPSKAGAIKMEQAPPPPSPQTSNPQNEARNDIDSFRHIASRNILKQPSARCFLRKRQQLASTCPTASIAGIFTVAAVQRDKPHLR